MRLGWRLDWIRSSGIGFARQVDVDLRSIPGPLIAVTGENGAGKTIFVESIMGLLDRTLPTRGSLVELAKLSGDRHAYLEGGIVNGKPWTIRHDIDGVSGKGESSVIGPDGQALPDSKVTSFDEWSSHTFDPPEVRLSSVFSQQKATGFLDMTPGERRKIVLRVCGAEALEADAAKARKLAGEAKARLDILHARLKDLSDGAPDVDVAAGDLEAESDAMAKADASLTLARESLLKTEASACVAQAAHDAEADRKRKLAEAAGRRDAAKRRLDDLDSRIANNASVLARAEEIRAAVDRTNVVDADLERATTREMELDRALIDTRAQVNAAEAALQSANRRVSAAIERAAIAGRRLADRDRILRAVEAVKQAEREIAAGEADVSTLEAEVERLQTLSVGVTARRIESLRCALSTIASMPPEGDDAAPRQAAGALELDDIAAKDAADAPGHIAVLKSRLAEMKRRVVILRTHLAEERRTAALATGLDQAEADKASAETERIAAHEEQRVQSEAKARVTGIADTMSHDLAEVRRDLAACRKQREELAPTLKLVDALTKAEARLAELEPQRSAAASEIDEVVGVIIRLNEDAPVELPPIPDVDGARACVASAQRHADAASHRVETARDTLARARQDAEKVAALRSQVDGEQEAVSDYTRLAGDLVLLQQMAVDAAGPELTTIANDLLHTCHGPRWTVSIETLRASSDGKRGIEGFDVKVTDSQEGRDVLGERLSGGEMVIVSEAIHLALSVMGCRGMEGCTLVRDETSGALDPKASRAYVAMLRKAARDIGARHVLFISHDAQMADMADARIEVSGGQVTIATN